MFGRRVGVGMERGSGGVGWGCGVIKCHRGSYVPALHLRQDARRMSSRHKSRCEEGTGAGGEGDTTVTPIHPFVTSPHRAEWLLLRLRILLLFLTRDSTPKTSCCHGISSLAQAGMRIEMSG